MSEMPLVAQKTAIAIVLARFAETTREALGYSE